MSKSSRKKVRRRREAEHDAFLRQLDRLYGNQRVERDVFGRRAALPSEIARHLQNGQPRSLP
jgi:hypothetical protein